MAKHLSIAEKRQKVMHEATYGNEIASDAMRVIEFLEDKLDRYVKSGEKDRPDCRHLNTHTVLGITRCIECGAMKGSPRWP